MLRVVGGGVNQISAVSLEVLEKIEIDKKKSQILITTNII
jgi:hypothetical protein